MEFKEGNLEKPPKSLFFSAEVRSGPEETVDDSILERISIINDRNNNDLISPDENVIIQALEQITELLDICQSIKILDDFVIMKILNLGNSKNEQIINYIVDIISWITILDDSELKPYLYLHPSFKHILLNIISFCRNSEIIFNALNALCEMINDKSLTIQCIDGEDLYKSAIFILYRIHSSKKYFRTNKSKGQRKIQLIFPAFTLLSRCMCFFDAPDDLIMESKNEFTFYLSTAKYDRFKPFIISLIFDISYHQSERAINCFSEDIIQFIFSFATEKTNSTQIIESIFGTLNNMAHKSDQFAINLLSNSPLFEIKCDREWTDMCFFNYFRLQDTIFLRMPLCDRNEKDWQLSIENIRNHLDFIISNGLGFFDLYSFKTKKQLILMTCHLFLIDDSELITKMCPHQNDLITLFIDHLECSSIKLTFEIAKTILFLLKKSSVIENIKVLDILKQNNISNIIENIMKEAEADNEIRLVFEQIQIMSQDLF